MKKMKTPHAHVHEIFPAFLGMDLEMKGSCSRINVLDDINDL